LRFCRFAMSPWASTLRLSNSNDGSTSDRLERRKHSGYEWLQIAKAIRESTENDDGDVPEPQVLLIRNTPVDSNKNVETGAFGRVEQTTVLQARQFGEAGGLAVVAGKQKAHALVNALID
jgi:hypothetical protein